MKDKLIIVFSLVVLALTCLFVGYAVGYLDRSAKYGDSLNWKYEFKSCSQDK